jgi:excisionase family DNA binding protein
MMTLRQAAALLGLAPSTLRLQVKRGRLGARRFGRDWLTTPEDVETYRAEHLGRIGRKGKVAE